MDWKLLIAQLRAIGLTQEAIADYCKCGQSTVSELSTGKTKQPSYSLGESLTALHKKHRRQINNSNGSPIIQG